MATLTEGRLVATELPNLESARSGMSWGAVLAGGLAAVGVSLILLVLGSGLGLASVSPWASASVSATGLAIGAAIWLVVVQWLASGFGGYVAGRLRTKWADRFSDEVFFRDTAHGFLAWAVGTVLMVGVFAFAGMSAVTATALGVGAIASQADESTADAYYVGQLFRTAAPPADATATNAPNSVTTDAAANDAATREATPIFARAVLGNGAETDRTYLGQLVSQRTGLAQPEAEQRVDQVIAEAKQAADTARKASATASIMQALAWLIGAFVGAVAGALGGRHRDELTEVG
jgi:hypothetical protein